MKLLMIDDDEAILQVMSMVLGKAGYIVTTALTAKEGIAAAIMQQPDIILLDQILPDLPGLDVLVTLKQTIETKEIPIVIFTDYGDSDIRKQALDAGAEHYLLKYEIDQEELGVFLRTILTQRKDPVL